MSRIVHALPRNSAFFISPLDDVDLPLPANSQRAVEVQFFTNDARLHNGTIELTAGPDCNASITLRGLGSGTVTLEPEQVDFGLLASNDSKSLEVRLHNTRRTSVQVFALQLQERSPTTTFTAMLPALPMTLQPLSSQTFTVTASPPTDLTFDAELIVATNFGVARTFLRVVGGQPIAEVSPASFDVPLAPFEPWTRSPAWIQRDFRVRNASSGPRPPQTAPPPLAAQLLDAHASTSALGGASRFAGLFFLFFDSVRGGPGGPAPSLATPETAPQINLMVLATSSPISPKPRT